MYTFGIQIINKKISFFHALCTSNKKKRIIGLFLDSRLRTCTFYLFITVPCYFVQIEHFILIQTPGTYGIIIRQKELYEEIFLKKWKMFILHTLGRLFTIFVIVFIHV